MNKKWFKLSIVFLSTILFALVYIFKHIDLSVIILLTFISIVLTLFLYFIEKKTNLKIAYLNPMICLLFLVILIFALMIEETSLNSKIKSFQFKILDSLNEKRNINYIFSKNEKKKSTKKELDLKLNTYSGIVLFFLNKYPKYNEIVSNVGFRKNSINEIIFFYSNKKNKAECLQPDSKNFIKYLTANILLNSSFKNKCIQINKSKNDKNLLISNFQNPYTIDLSKIMLVDYFPEEIKKILISNPRLLNKLHKELYLVSNFFLEEIALIRDNEEITKLKSYKNIKKDLQNVSSHINKINEYLSNSWIQYDLILNHSGKANLNLTVSTPTPLLVNSIYFKNNPNIKLRTINSSNILEGFKIEPIYRYNIPGFTSTESNEFKFSISGLPESKTLALELLESLEISATNLVTGMKVSKNNIFGLIRVKTNINLYLCKSQKQFLNKWNEIVEGNFVPTYNSQKNLIKIAAATYHVKSNLIFPCGTDVLFEPGVNFELDEKVSVLIRGSLNINGTKKKPITISAKNYLKPWGVIAVQGFQDKLSTIKRSSNISYLRISGGSEAYLNDIYYTGQLSIFESDVDIDNSYFSNSFGDDALNVKRGEVLIKKTTFENTASDAIDLDWCNGLVDSIYVNNTGINGDGIDISESKIVLNNSIFKNITDKAISLGEQSNLKTNNIMILLSNIGIASKDNSDAIVKNLILHSTNLGLTAYQKKRVFSSARIFVEDIFIFNTKVNIDRDKESTIKINNGWSSINEKKFQFIELIPLSYFREDTSSFEEKFKYLKTITNAH